MVNELRLNNWIIVHYDVPKEIQVTVNNIEHLVNYAPEIIMRGIPINEEWLVKMGFVKNKNHGIENYINCDSAYYIENKHLKIHDRFGGYIYVENILYVHQLQNAFQSLTQKELIIVNK